jgi:hypothetical protein
MPSAAERWRRLMATETWRGGVGEEVEATERWRVGGGGEDEVWRQRGGEVEAAAAAERWRGGELEGWMRRRWACGVGGGGSGGGGGPVEAAAAERSMRRRLGLEVGDLGVFCV